MLVNTLSETEYHSYYHRYIQKIPENITLIEGYLNGKEDIIDFFKSIPEDKLEYSYTPEKWTIKEVFQHIIDTERVFMYRCLRISRHDKTPLSGFEQDDYIKPSQANKKEMDNLLEEYRTVRDQSIVFLKSLHDNDLKCIGISDENQLSARAAACIVLGHEIWHVDIIKARYL